MHTRRLVAFLLGVWLGGLVFVAFVTSANSWTTKSIVDNPSMGARQTMDLSGKERSAMLLRYTTAEHNRTLIESWEWLQLALAIGLVATLPFALRLKWGYLIAAVIMLLIAIADKVLLTPQIVGVGRLLDMAGGDAWTQDELWKERRSLYTLEMLYWSGEAVKGLIGLGLTSALLIFRGKGTLKTSRSRRRTTSGTRDGLEDIDSINNANYSHVDR